MVSAGAVVVFWLRAGGASPAFWSATAGGAARGPATASAGRARGGRAAPRELSFAGGGVAMGKLHKQWQVQLFSACRGSRRSEDFQDTKLRLLLERGASIAVGVSPLLILCGDRREADEFSPNAEALQLLLSHGCDIMETGGRGKNAVELLDLHLRTLQDRISENPDIEWLKNRVFELQSMMSVLALASTSLLKSAHEEIGSLKKDAEQRPGASKRTAAGKAKKKKARS